ncbi:MAG: response regulator [Polyangiaceae bacterium]|jgi:CheY-like chemotaxis protein
MTKATAAAEPVLPAAPSSARLPQPHARGRQRVLVVDDNHDARVVLSAIVEHAGHAVVVARDGAEALAVVAGFHPSVAIIDIGLPDMNGYELATHIRAGHGDDTPYLVALSGYGQASDRDRSSAAGFDVHLVKPVDLDQFLRVIEEPRVSGEFRTDRRSVL